MTGLVAALRKEVDASHEANKLIRHEWEIDKAKAQAQGDLLRWVYQRSRAGLFTVGDRAARDKALSEINAKVGGYIR